ncbi:MAG: alkaline phosphatase family protein [Stackebrandtia sp.]
MKIETELLRTAAPEYGRAALSDVLPSALALLGDEDSSDVLGLEDRLSGVRRIAVLLVDGLGYHLLREAAASSPTLASGLDGTVGSLRRLTTGFPSTTPTSLTSLGAGVAPGEHGLVGFTVRIPGSDQLLCHIVWGDTPDPAKWQPTPTCFERAVKAGISAGVVSSGAFEGTGLTVSAFRGGAYCAADGVESVAAGMRAALSREAPCLVYGYYPFVDKAGHLHGAGSPEWHAAVAGLERLLRLLLADLPADAALLVTADHGMINVPDDERIDLADHPRLRDGVRLIAGEPRARYVHTEPGAAVDVAAAWRETLGEHVDVVTRAEALAAGWLGHVVPDAHAARVGDVVAVCRGRHVILGVPECDSATVSLLRGYHGGLTEAEIAIPLWAIRGDALAR